MSPVAPSPGRRGAGFLFPATLLAFWCVLSSNPAGAQDKAAPSTQAQIQVVHVFVALCDNASQGIVPVPAKIGDGDKPDANLYWGCSDGTKSYFRASKLWAKQAAVPSPRSEVLERIVFKHKVRSHLYLVADAWRGREIKPCMQAFVSAASGEFKESPVKLQTGTGDAAREVSLPLAAEARWLAYIGHNGLMEFEVQWPKTPAPAAGGAASTPREAFAFCCIGERYFTQLGAPLLLTTKQLMYPGAFILHDALEPAFDGKPTTEIKAAAARAYARNQKISVKAASGVFAAKGE